MLIVVIPKLARNLNGFSVHHIRNEHVFNLAQVWLDERICHYDKGVASTVVGVHRPPRFNRLAAIGTDWLTRNDGHSLKRLSCGLIMLFLDRENKRALEILIAEV